MLHAHWDASLTLARTASRADTPEDAFVLLLETHWNEDPQPAVSALETTQGQMDVLSSSLKIGPQLDSRVDYQISRHPHPGLCPGRHRHGRRELDALRRRVGEAADGRRRLLLSGRGGRLAVAGKGVREGEAAEWVGRRLLLPLLWGGRRHRSGRRGGNRRRGDIALLLRVGEAADDWRSLLGGRGGRGGRLAVAGKGVRKGEAAEWVGRRLLLLLLGWGGLAKWGLRVIFCVIWF